MQVMSSYLTIRDGGRACACTGRSGGDRVGFRGPGSLLFLNSTPPDCCIILPDEQSSVSTQATSLEVIVQISPEDL